MKDEFEDIVGFQWDDGNTDKNRINHQVENWECEQVFFNTPLIVLGGLKHSGKEERWAAFGCTDDRRRLVVIFIKRGNLLRMVSAGDMNRKERKFYEENG